MVTRRVLILLYKLPPTLLPSLRLCKGITLHWACHWHPLSKTEATNLNFKSQALACPGGKGQSVCPTLHQNFVGD